MPPGQRDEKPPMNHRVIPSRSLFRVTSASWSQTGHMKGCFSRMSQPLSVRRAFSHIAVKFEPWNDAATADAHGPNRSELIDLSFEPAGSERLAEVRRGLVPR